MSQHLPPSVALRAVEEVTAGTGVSPREVFSLARAHRVSHRRQAAMVRLRALEGDDGKPLYSLPEIGRAFGRDHTTVLHALRQYSRRIHRTRTVTSNPLVDEPLAARGYSAR